MAESSIDKLTLDIVINNNNAVRRLNAITKSVEKLNSALKKSDIDKTIKKINNVSLQEKVAEVPVVELVEMLMCLPL